MAPSATTPRDRPHPTEDIASGIVPMTRHTLRNGLQVVVVPDRRSPVVTHMVWYRNGSADDPPGKSGIAHFLEHLMFKGTATYPAGHFSALLAELGGQENAFTSNDVTAYFQRVPKQHLATCMAYEADRMTNLVLTDAVVAPERDVVLAERGMVVDAKPDRVLDEAVQAAAFSAHPSGRPVIGWRHEIESLSRDDALAHYQLFYAPQNAIVVVAGDAEPEAVIALAEAAYGPIPPSETPPRSRVQDPPALMHRQITLADARVRQPRLMRVHAVPSYRTAAPGEAEALEVLAFLLGGDETSILHTRLVLEQPCATTISVAYWDTAIDLSRFRIDAVPAPGVSPDALERAVEAVFRDLLADGFPEDAVARAKTQILAAAFYNRDSQIHLANWYGMSLSCGIAPEDLAVWPSRIEAVTPEALHRALLRLDRRSAVSGYLLEAAAAA